MRGRRGSRHQGPEEMWCVLSWEDSEEVRLTGMEVEEGKGWLDRESWETRLYRAFSATPCLGFYSELGGKPFKDFEEQRDTT